MVGAPWWPSVGYALCTACSGASEKQHTKPSSLTEEPLNTGELSQNQHQGVLQSPLCTKLLGFSGVLGSQWKQKRHKAESADVNRLCCSSDAKCCQWLRLPCTVQPSFRRLVYFVASADRKSRDGKNTEEIRAIFIYIYIKNNFQNKTVITF